jgi:hypothetical protein
MSPAADIAEFTLTNMDTIVVQICVGISSRALHAVKHPIT